MRFYEIKEAILDKNVARDNTEDVDNIKIANLLKTKCSDALAAYFDGKRIYKGFTSPDRHSDAMIMNVSNIERKSQNTNNLYTYFTSQVSQKWKKFPPRDRSIICATDIGIANSYTQGNVNGVYIVFPFNGNEVGVCPADDMWNSFQNSRIYDLAGFVEILDNICRKWANKENNANLNFTNYATKYYPEFMNQFCSVLVDNSDPETSKDLGFELPASEDDTVAQYLDVKLDPDSNEFTLIDTSRFKLLPNHNEVWVSGMCALVRFTHMNEIVAIIKGKNNEV